MAVKLLAGFTHVNRGTADYKGVLRATPKSAPAWTCTHNHLSAEAARRCADFELESRKQGSREVISLRWCEPCGRWWPDGDAPACPVCSVPMERVKLVVLERTRMP
jgi:hypothetical protein